MANNTVRKVLFLTVFSPYNDKILCLNFEKRDVILRIIERKHNSIYDNNPKLQSALESKQIVHCKLFYFRKRTFSDIAKSDTSISCANLKWSKGKKVGNAKISAQKLIPWQIYANYCQKKMHIFPLHKSCKVFRAGVASFFTSCLGQKKCAHPAFCKPEFVCVCVFGCMCVCVHVYICV